VRSRIFSAAAILLSLILFPCYAGAQDGTLPAPEAWAALERGDASKAAAIFREEIDRAPRNAVLYFGSAYASVALGRTDAAMSALRHAIEYNPKFVQAHVLLAQLAYQSADLDLAVRSLEKAAALAPQDQQIAAQLAQWKKESSLHQGFQTQPGVRFNVMFEGPAQKPIGDRVSAVLESAYWNIGQRLNIYPGQALNVILYSTRQFRDITHAPSWAAGGYDGRIRVPVAGALKTPGELDRVLTHEYVHAVILSAAPKGVPAWLNEGLASYMETSDKAWVARTLKNADGRISMDDLVEGFGGFDGGTAMVAYAESHIAAQLLCEKLGAYVGPFLQMLGNGATVDQALSAHGVEPAAFYAEWKKRVGLK
jgi:tetratricopeptide (TPR) repeat protein